MEEWMKLYAQDLEQVKSSIVSAEKLKGKSFLITGATGGVGSHFVDVLLHLNAEYHFGCTLYLCGRDTEKMRKRFGDNKEIVYLRYDARQEIPFAIPADYMIHLAGNADPLKFQKNPVETSEINLVGAVNMLRYASQFVKEKIVYVSTGEIYGVKEKDSPWKEKESGYVDIQSVRSAYPLSKRAAENLCMTYFEQRKLPVVIARLSHTFGATFHETDSRIHNVFMRQALDGQDIVLHSSGSQIRSYCYVSDSVSGMLSLLTEGASGEAYNISNPDNAVSIKEFAEKIAKAAGVSVQTEYAEETYFNKMNHAVLDTEKIEMLGWKPNFDLDTAIERTMKILSKRKKRRDDTFTTIETQRQ